MLKGFANGVFVIWRTGGRQGGHVGSQAAAGSMLGEQLQQPTCQQQDALEAWQVLSAAKQLARNHMADACAESGI